VYCSKYCIELMCTVLKPERIRRVREPKLRWSEWVEEDPKNKGRLSGDLSRSIENIGEQLWKNLCYTKDCNARRRKRCIELRFRGTRDL